MSLLPRPTVWRYPVPALLANRRLLSIRARVRHCPGAAQQVDRQQNRYGRDELPIIQYLSAVCDMLEFFLILRKPWSGTRATRL